MKHIAVIGTRDIKSLLEDRRLSFSKKISNIFQEEVTIHTGAAKGVDQCAAILSAMHSRSVVLHLPRKGYETEWVDTMSGYYKGLFKLEVYRPTLHQEAMESVDKYHPNPGSLTNGMRCLHARNYLIIEPCSLVIALPKSSSELGGTGQGMRIAEGLGKKLIVL